MALDLDTSLADQVGPGLDGDSRRAVARVLLAMVHDLNGSLGAAQLRASSVQRSLARLAPELDGPGGASAVALLERANDSHAELRAALVDLRDLLARISDAAWTLDEQAPA